jgi:hypothetical protein
MSSQITSEDFKEDFNRTQIEYFGSSDITPGQITVIVVMLVIFLVIFPLAIYVLNKYHYFDD